jgi:hypothetical protein
MDAPAFTSPLNFNDQGVRAGSSRSELQRLSLCPLTIFLLDLRIPSHKVRLSRREQT